MSHAAKWVEIIQKQKEEKEEKEKVR